MFSLIKKISEYFVVDAEAKRKEQERILDELYKKLESDDETETTIEAQLAADEVKLTDCFRKIGIITDIENNTGEIDHLWRFNSQLASNCFNELEKGTKVKYLAYRHSDEIPVRIVRVEEIITEAWDGTRMAQKTEAAIQELQQQAPEYFHVFERVYLAAVTGKRKNYLTVDLQYTDLTCNLDEVEAEFLALEGDYVVLQCDVQRDDTFVDSNGEIVKVKRLGLPKTVESEGRITKFDETQQCGVVSNKYFFYADVLPSGYKLPSVNDKVKFVAVETVRMPHFSTEFEQRCIKIEPLQGEENVINRMLNLEPQFNSTLMQNKHGIVISDHLSFMFSDVGGESEKKKLLVKNTSDKVWNLIGIRFDSKKKFSQFLLVSPRSDQRFELKPGDEVVYQLLAKPRFHGAATEVIIFAFARIGAEKFEIGRKLEIEVEDTERKHPSRGTGPSFRNKQYTANTNAQLRSKDIIPGERPGGKGPNFVDIKISQYFVPDNIRNAVLRFHTNAEVEEEINSKFHFFQNGLNIINHELYFRTLLYLEEVQFEHNIRQYDTDRAHFGREGEFLALPMANIAERRPSLVIGDSVIATRPWSQSDRNNSYQGFIHFVKNNRILFKFNPSFQERYNGEDYKLVFSFSRSSFMKQQHALSTVKRNLGSEYLFPNGIQLKPVHMNLEVRTSDLQMVDRDCNDRVYPWYNQNLNIIQKEAVKNVLRGDCRPMPYIIFGPPGTGKTMTVIEIILQLSQASNNNRLLIATPSNSAANLITERLIDSGMICTGEFVRIVGYNWIQKELISDKLAPHCVTVEIASERTISENNMIVTESGLRLKCQSSFLGRHRVIISTCASLGSLMQIRFPPNHFTHVIIDEAGQCVEPESLIPISLISKETGHVILAGDPEQLGPVVLSPFAVNRGLGASFLSRMLEQTPYKKDRERFVDGYDPRLVTKLLNNYRSLPSILKCYSDLFYEKELEPMISSTGTPEREILDRVRQVFELPDADPDCGLFFIGTQGNEMQVIDSPSWFNSSESSQVFLILTRLYALGIKCDDVGIISPYQQQVKSIRRQLEDANLATPKIGSVEEFQGQERSIIIISTVRSKKTLLQKDFKFALGFVRSPKRMNVAISRAKSVLIIIGNPKVLSLDTNWRHLLKEAYRNNTYTGCTYPPELTSTIDNSQAELKAIQDQVDAEEAAVKKSMHEALQI